MDPLTVALLDRRVGSLPGSIFYVDATLGNDAWDGLSQTRPLKTLGRVNALLANSTISAGDQIALKRGETWNGQWTIAARGSRRLPITISAYGEGAKPVIDGQGVQNGCAIASSCNIVVSGLAFKNGLDFSLVITDSSRIRLYDIEASGAGNDNVLFSTNSHHCEVHGVHSYDPAQTAAGSPLYTCFEIKDGCHDIAVTDFRFSGATLGAGFSVHDHEPLQGDGMPYNITFDGGTIQDCGLFGFQVMKQSLAADPRPLNIRVRNVSVSGSCQEVFRIIHASGAAGLKDGDVEIDGLFGNVMHATELNALGRVQSRVTVRNSVMAGRYPLQVSTGGWGRFEHCTFYRQVNQPLNVNTGGLGLEVFDSIILAGGNEVIRVLDDSVTLAFDRNQYHALTAPGVLFYYGGTSNGHTLSVWQTEKGLDLNSATGDPLFVDKDAGDFRLSVGSPAIGTAEDGADRGAIPYV